MTDNYFVKSIETVTKKFVWAMPANLTNDSAKDLLEIFISRDQYCIKRSSGKYSLVIAKNGSYGAGGKIDVAFFNKEYVTLHELCQKSSNITALLDEYKNEKISISTKEMMHLIVNPILVKIGKDCVKEPQPNITEEETKQVGQAGGKKKKGSKRGSKKKGSKRGSKKKGSKRVKK